MSQRVEYLEVAERLVELDKTVKDVEIQALLLKICSVWCFHFLSCNALVLFMWGLPFPQVSVVQRVKYLGVFHKGVEDLELYNWQQDSDTPRIRHVLILALTRPNFAPSQLT